MLSSHAFASRHGHPQNKKAPELAAPGLFTLLEFFRTR